MDGKFDVSYDNAFLSAAEIRALLKHLQTLPYVPKIGPNPMNSNLISISTNLYRWVSERKSAIPKPTQPAASASVFFRSSEAVAQSRSKDREDVQFRADQLLP